MLHQYLHSSVHKVEEPLTVIYDPSENLMAGIHFAHISCKSQNLLRIHFLPVFMNGAHCLFN